MGKLDLNYDEELKKIGNRPKKKFFVKMPDIFKELRYKENDTVYNLKMSKISDRVLDIFGGVAIQMKNKESLDKFKNIFLNNLLEKKVPYIRTLYKDIGFKSLFKNNKIAEDFLDSFILYYIFTIIPKTQSNYKEFLNDKSTLEFKYALKEGLFETSEFNETTLEQKLIVLRNALINGKKITKKSLLVELKSYIENIKKISKLKVFEGRKIISIIGNEKDKKGKSKFSKKAIDDYFKEKSYNNYQKFYKESSVFKKATEIDSYINSILKKIEKTKGPRLFFLSSHGYKNDFQIDHNFYEKSGLSQLKIKKFMIPFISKKKTNDINKKDIIIFDDCYSYNFAENLYKELKKYNADLPIIITASELGQNSYGDSNEFGSIFAEKILGMGDKNKVITIGDIIKNQHKSKKSNPTIFIPTDDGNYNQIASIKLDKNFIA